jgi:Ni,Fe-hydrogenase maturation factor
MVVFVDASVDAAEVTVQRVDAEPSGPKTMTHHGDPATLLSLVPSIGALPERAYVVSIPATNLEMGLELTAATQAAASEAVGRIVELLSGYAA